MSCPSKRDLARGRLGQSQDGAADRAFARALILPTSPSTSPRADLEGDAIDRAQNLLRARDRTLRNAEVLRQG